MQRAGKLIILLVAGFCLIGLIAGRTYEIVGERRDKQRLAQIGRSVDIGDRSLNIFCTGTGDPPVILESRAGLVISGRTSSLRSQSLRRRAGMTAPAKRGAIRNRFPGRVPPSQR